MATYYEKETIETVKSISALQYMLDHEQFSLMKKGSTYFLKEHDSLYFSNGFWRWSSRGIGGKDALGYLQAVQGMDFKDAMALLCELYNIVPEVSKDYSQIRAANLQRSSELEATIAKRENMDFELPEAAENNKRVYAYLKKRGISDEVIRYCLKNRYVYQEAKHGNCVFVGYDNGGEARYAGLRSTGYVNFKGDAAGSNKSFSFRLTNITSSTVHVFEAPIDLLSYATYMQLNGFDFTKTNLLALAGVAVPQSNGQTKIPDAISTLLEGRDINKFILHLDNDSTGKAAAQALGSMLESKGYKVTNVPVPEEMGKDVNDYLLNYLERQKNLKPESIRKQIKEITMSAEPLEPVAAEHAMKK